MEYALFVCIKDQEEMVGYNPALEVKVQTAIVYGL